MLITSQVTKLEMYDTPIESLHGGFRMGVKLTKVQRYNYDHLKGIKIEDHNTKEQLPVHVVPGSGEYA